MRQRLIVATHNMTEGPVTRAVAHADIVFGQEIDAAKVRRGLPHHQHFFPEHDPHLSVSWNPEKVKVRTREAIRVHGSGAHEGYPFATPARHVVVLDTVVDGADLRLIDCWPINSAFNLKPDPHKALRRVLWHRYMDVVDEQVAEAPGDVLLAGDFNNFRGRFTPKGVAQANRGWGLDRIFYSPGLRLLRKPWEGPKTGVGPDMEHKSVHALFEIGD